METTHSTSRKHPIKPLHAAVGVVLSLGAFVFGGFWAILALPGILPSMRPYFGLFAGLFVGAACIHALTGFGFDPVLDYARQQAVTRIEHSLQGSFEYRRFSGNVLTGEMQFEGASLEIPAIDGTAGIRQINVEAGWIMLVRFGPVRITGRGFDVSINAADGRLEGYLESLPKQTGAAIEMQLDDGRVAVTGSPIEARLEVTSLRADVDALGWSLATGMSKAELTVNGRAHELEVVGGFKVQDRGHGLTVDVDLRATDDEVGSGILRGALRPGVQGGIRCTIDRLDLNPLWARYRKVDSYDGFARGTVDISGSLDNLSFAFWFEVRDYRYFHLTAMGLDRENAFALPEAEVHGRIDIINGREWHFHDVTIHAPDATLATGPRINARGSGEVVLNGKYPALEGRLTAVVESGEINQRISFSLTSRAGLSAIQPNIVLVGEQFPRLDLTWEVEIKAMTVAARPLTGTLSGTLRGIFSKQEGRRQAGLRAEGELVLTDGRVQCLGLDAEVAARVIFNPNAPTQHATLRGQMTGALGDTVVDCEVTGEIGRPGFIFHRAGMSAEALGRLIFSYSPEPLTAAQQRERVEECSRIFGPNAAAKQNPFEARHSGKIFFNVR